MILTGARHEAFLTSEYLSGGFSRVVSHASKTSILHSLLNFLSFSHDMWFFCKRSFAAAQYLLIHPLNDDLCFAIIFYLASSRVCQLCLQVLFGCRNWKKIFLSSSRMSCAIELFVSYSLRIIAKNWKNCSVVDISRSL